jgi:flagellar basal body-associated protein FliL
MKKFKYIVATLFVVAIGAGIFWACQKEETTENSSITTTSNKIQKENLPPCTVYTK